MKKETIWRAFFYGLGIVLLCLGVTLNTKTGLGVSPVTAVPFAISNGFGWRFSTVLFWYYIACVLLQCTLRGPEWKDLLQVPLSLAFSVVQGWLGSLLQMEITHLWQSVALLPFAVVFTGFGISLMVNMRLVPNPADGVPFTLAQVTKKEMGLVKNVVDAALVVLALSVDLLLSGHITSLGAGTIVAMIFNGRAVALCDRLFRRKITFLAGVNE